jgi:hypothetical protein
LVCTLQSELVPFHIVTLDLKKELEQHSENIAATSDDYQNFETFYEESHHENVSYFGLVFIHAIGFQRVFLNKDIELLLLFLFVPLKNAINIEIL